MAIFHLHSQEVSKSSGRSIIAMAAYRAGERLIQKVENPQMEMVVGEIIHDYTNKGNVLHSEILAPDYAPDWVYDRQSLWSNVELAEKRKDAVLVNEMDVAIPIELNPEQGVKLVKDYVEKHLVSKGMIVDFSIHWEEGNPHAHIMQVTREIGIDGFGKKNRDWHRREGLKEKRRAWAEITNEHLLKYGHDVTIDHRSYITQGIDLNPTTHEGVIADILEMRGVVSELRAENEKRIADNINKLDEKPEILLESLAQNRATFTKEDIAKELFKRVRGDEHSFDRIFTKVMASEALIKLEREDIRGKDRYSEKTYFEAEKDLLANAGSMMKLEQPKYSDIKKLEKFIANTGNLSKQQEEAVHYIANPDSDIAVLVGRAGTGKTTTLKVLSDYYKSIGFNVKGTALAGIAALNLSNEAGIESKTITSWKYQWNSEGVNKLSKKDVFIVDEAGMVHTKDLHYIVKEAREAGAKVILVGDNEQLQPIEAGQALRGIIDIAGATEISKVFRQREGWMKEATEGLARGDIEKSVKSYDEHNKIKWQENKDASINQLVKDYLDYAYENTDKSQVIMAYTRKDVEKLNRLVRDNLKKQGSIQDGILFKTSQGKKEFALNDRVLFLKNDYDELDVRNGTLGRVISFGKSGFMKVEVGEGKNKRKIEVNTFKYDNITHGYASTVHKSQGLTVDKALLLADKNLKSNAVYVGLSRHRDDVNLYVNKGDFKDINDLSNSFSRSELKDLVVDYKNTNNQEEGFKNVKSYLGLIEEAKKFVKDINDWGNKELKEIISYPHWADFKRVREKREDYAKKILGSIDSHKKFIKEARINFGLLKNHSGYKERALAGSEAIEYRLFKEYAVSKLPKIAWFLTDNRVRNSLLYSEWFKKHNINPEELNKDSTEGAKLEEVQKIQKIRQNLKSAVILINDAMVRKDFDKEKLLAAFDYISKAREKYVAKYQDERHEKLKNDLELNNRYLENAVKSHKLLENIMIGKEVNLKKWSLNKGFSKENVEQKLIDRINLLKTIKDEEKTIKPVINELDIGKLVVNKALGVFAIDEKFAELQKFIKAKSVSKSEDIKSIVDSYIKLHEEIDKQQSHKNKLKLLDNEVRFANEKYETVNKKYTKQKEEVSGLIDNIYILSETAKIGVQLAFDSDKPEILKDILAKADLKGKEIVGIASHERKQAEEKLPAFNIGYNKLVEFYKNYNSELVRLDRYNKEKEKLAKELLIYEKTAKEREKSMNLYERQIKQYFANQKDNTKLISAFTKETLKELAKRGVISVSKELGIE